MARWVVLIVWCLFLFGYGLSGPLYRTEALRAKIAQETMAGNWLVPTLYGQPFVTKPPGCYVAIAICSVPFGQVSEVSARLPSAIAAFLTVIFVYLHLKTLTLERVAFWVAMFLPVSFLWLDKSPSAEIDMLQLAWVTWSLLAFHRAYGEHQAGKSSLIWWGISLFCVAGGLLTKWTAPAFFYLTVIPFLIVQRQWKLLFSRNHLLAAMMAVALVAFWAIYAAEQIGWETLQETIGNEAAQRFAPGKKGKPYPWLESITFPFLVLAANTVSSVAVMLTLRRRFLSKLSVSEHSFAILAHCWLWPNLLFWMLPAQHNVRYLLPMIPAFGILGGIWWVKAFENSTKLSRRLIFWAPLIAWCAVKIVFVEVVAHERVANRNAREIGGQLAELVPIGERLTIDKLKDEGILFYYGRPVSQQRWEPKSTGARWGLLLESEWQKFEKVPAMSLVAKLRDQQGSPIYLVRQESSELAACHFLIPQLHPNLRPSVR